MPVTRHVDKLTLTDIPQEFLDNCAIVARCRFYGYPRLPSDPQPCITSSSFPQYTTKPDDSPYSVWEAEAVFYYSGLPSNPRLIFRNGTTPWKPPTGPEAYRELKEIKPVFGHKIVAVWNDLGPKVCGCLDSLQVSWTSVDVVRFNVVEKAPGPPVLWIGVMPQSLSGKVAHTAAVGCQKLLELYNITDVEVEFRKSVFTRFAGPKLLKPVFFTDPTADIRGPLTPALGLQIAAQVAPYTEGTGALYISEGHNSDKVYILAPRHVVFPPDAPRNNVLYHYTDVYRPRYEVLLLSPKAFQTLLRTIMTKIGDHWTHIKTCKEELDYLQDDDVEKRRDIEQKLTKEEAAMKAFNQLHDEITKYWSEESQRVLGHIVYSPPITVGTGTERYTEDWALIELDRNKIDWDAFEGNVVDMGTTDILSRVKFIKRMHPDPTDYTPSYDELLPLQGVIEADELCCPQTLDTDGESCLIVTKNGCTTGLTMGRATGVKSFVREYLPDGSQQTSMEWAILPYDQKSGAFSAPGDSGAIIVDGKGRIGGVLTGGCGETSEDADITYATPFYWLLQRIKTHFPDAHLYQPTA